MVQWNAECKPDGQMRRLVGSSFLLAAVPVNTECSESEPTGAAAAERLNRPCFEMRSKINELTR